VSNANDQDRSISYVKILVVLDILIFFVANHVVYFPTTSFISAYPWTDGQTELSSMTDIIPVMRRW